MKRPPLARYQVQNNSELQEIIDVQVYDEFGHRFITARLAYWNTTKNERDWFYTESGWRNAFLKAPQYNDFEVAPAVYASVSGDMEELESAYAVGRFLTASLQALNDKRGYAADAAEAIARMAEICKVTQVSVTDKTATTCRNDRPDTISSAVSTVRWLCQQWRAAHPIAKRDAA